MQIFMMNILLHDHKLQGPCMPETNWEAFLGALQLTRGQASDRPQGTNSLIWMHIVHTCLAMSERFTRGFKIARLSLWIHRLLPCAAGSKFR